MVGRWGLSGGKKNSIAQSEANPRIGTRGLLRKPGGKDFPGNLVKRKTTEMINQMGRDQYELKIDIKLYKIYLNILI